MSIPLDTYRAAQVVINQHGDEAEEYALSMMRKFMDGEDVKAASAWLIIAQAIQELSLKNEPGTYH